MIGKAAPFAQPVMKYFRALVAKTCPEAVETVKWGFSSYDYHGPLCSMAAFKNHMVIGFWKSALLKDPKGYLLDCRGERTGGPRCLGYITGMKDLPSDSIITGFLKQAMLLNQQGVKLPRKPKPEGPQAIATPDYFQQALKREPKALAVFGKASYSFRKEYIMWLEEAKTEATRQKRMETAVEWIAAGKGRNWKYEN